MPIRSLFRCPCCGFPTPFERGSFGICTICWWEDDGQDDPRADEVWGGPNGTCSLAAARENFRAHGHMYDQGDGIPVVEDPSTERRLLLSYVRSVLDGREALDEAALQALIDAEAKSRGDED